MLVGIIFPYICKYIYISHPHALCGPLGTATLDGAACICRPKMEGMFGWRGKWMLDT